MRGKWFVLPHVGFVQGHKKGPRELGFKQKEQTFNQIKQKEKALGLC